jgi:hypothetical protein
VTRRDFEKMLPKEIFAKKFAKISAFFAQTTACFFSPKLIIHWFPRKTPILSPKIGKNGRKL